jgi:hypothetical protein
MKDATQHRKPDTGDEYRDRKRTQYNPRLRAQRKQKVQTDLQRDQTDQNEYNETHASKQSQRADSTIELVQLTFQFINKMI